MKATIYFSENSAPPFEVNGGALSAYEIGSLTHIKDYDRDAKKIVFTVPTCKILFIEYQDNDLPKPTVTVKDIKKEVMDKFKEDWDKLESTK